MDNLDRKILSFLCLEGGVSVNLYQLAKNLRCHRNTVKARVDALFDNKILRPPRCFYNKVFEDLPLLSIDYVNYPPNNVDKLVSEPNMVGVYRVHEGEYNLLTFSLWKDVLSHKVWENKHFYEDKQVGDSEPVYIPAKMVFKNDFNAILPRIIEKNERVFGDYTLDDLSFKIMCYLIKGNFLWINEQAIAKKIGVHRKTVKRRISIYFKKKIISPPKCYFYYYLAPPSRLLSFSFFETKNPSFLQAFFKRDPHVVLLARVNRLGYTHIILSSHKSIASYTKWSDDFHKAFEHIGGSEVIFVPADNIIKSDFNPIIKKLLYSK